MNAPVQLPDISLNDKYTQETGRVYVTGQQAIIRMMLKQRQMDEANGLNTGGFISGYRGSPMTAIDVELWRAGEALLDDHHVKFWPGLNENLAMTAVWGSQKVGFKGDANYDGVYAMWYGKGPGLDQTMDGLRQATLHGSAKNGGVLVMVGDDPEMTSTVDPYHSELLFEDLLMPVLYPADIQEAFDFGFYGFALSRFCGSFVGYKLLPETIETAASIVGSIDRIKIATPEFDFGADGVNSRRFNDIYAMETRARKYKLPAALAFARSNNLNRVTLKAKKKKFGIAAMGKTWRDVQQALLDLGISEAKAKALGINILKVAMPFPSDDALYREFATGMDEVLVIEDKREQIQNGFTRACYDLPGRKRPRITGRTDDKGNPLVEAQVKLTSDRIAQIIASRIAYFHKDEKVKARLKFLHQADAKTASAASINTRRVPYFCSGCPHNTSTKVPEGSKGIGGVGCHYMATWMDREVEDFTHMGAEGATWIGEAPFVKTNHVFQQLGDGTYFHSGSLAIRAAVAAGVNITYKVLFNDAVAMTGGQPVDGVLTVPMITHQMYQEGVKRITVVTDEPDKYGNNPGFAKGTTVHHRRELDKVQRELRDIEGTTILIYDQTCAAEKRRRRKRGTFPDPAKRAFINDRVCEGCGDCSKKSNCLSVQPIETEYGRKRTIHQSSCNKDYSCVDGFCPSFLTVHGGDMKRGAARENLKTVIPEPELKTIAKGETYGALVAGVGGTGVITVGALLGMAAHLEGKGLSIVDQMGFAQKGGPVMSHIRFANTQDDINTARLNAGATDLLLGCDMLTAGGDAPLKTLKAGKTKAFLNMEANMSGDFIHDPDLRYPTSALQQRFENVLDRADIDYIDATQLALALTGDAIGSNLFLVGYAWQKGALPVGSAAIKKAIDINGVKPDWNKQAFEWGRLAAHDPQAVQALLDPKPKTEKSDAELIAARMDDLTAYQNTAYAARYKKLVDKVADAERDKAKGLSGLTRAVATYAYKLMAYKDEYEVARRQTSPELKEKLASTFEGDYKIKYHLSPPIFARKDPVSGRPRKYEIGGWITPLFKLMSKMKGLRGSAFDIFGYTEERKMERGLIEKYETTMEKLINSLDHDNHALAIEIACLPEKIRGYGYIKEDSVKAAHAELQDLMAKFENPVASPAAAE
jgi:indolepyruvate ferredoxin oxidoreductase